MVFDIKRAGNVRSEIHGDEGALLTVDLLPEDAETTLTKTGDKEESDRLLHLLREQHISQSQGRGSTRLGQK
ncbi:MAG: hypothetical protein ACOX4B_06300 [Bacillota bacterium]